MLPKDCESWIQVPSDTNPKRAGLGYFSVPGNLSGEEPLSVHDLHDFGCGLSPFRCEVLVVVVVVPVPFPRLLAFPCSVAKAILGGVATGQSGLDFPNRSGALVRVALP